MRGPHAPEIPLGHIIPSIRVSIIAVKGVVRSPGVRNESTLPVEAFTEGDGGIGDETARNVGAF